jgi:hypothetical protein
MSQTETKRISEAISAHVDSCEQCRADVPETDRLLGALASERIGLDPAALSVRAMAHAAPDLAQRAQAAFRRQVGIILLLALVPLPGVLLWGAYVLRFAYEAVSSVLPAGFAAYLIISYALSALVILTASYAAIPVLLERLRGAQPAAASLVPGESLEMV